MLVPSRLANATVATSINKRLCQHTVNEPTIQSTRAGLGRCDLAFAVINCVLNRRFAAATVGSCDGLPERPTIWLKMLFLFWLCFFFCTTPTNRDLRQKAVYFPARFGGPAENLSSTISQIEQKWWLYFIYKALEQCHRQYF